VALDEADARVGARTAEVLAHLVRVGVGVGLGVGVGVGVGAGVGVRIRVGLRV
jgi:hypothetical protein